MNAGEFERRNNRTIMATGTRIAKKARSKAEADFATWLMMAKLGSFDELSSNAQKFLINYRARLEMMSEAESTAGRSRGLQRLLQRDGRRGPRRNRKLADRRQRAASFGSRDRLNLSPLHQLRAIRPG
jgi:hypothetical protein